MNDKKISGEITAAIGSRKNGTPLTWRDHAKLSIASRVRFKKCQMVPARQTSISCCNHGLLTTLHYAAGYSTLIGMIVIDIVVQNTKITTFYVDPPPPRLWLCFLLWWGPESRWIWETVWFSSGLLIFDHMQLANTLLCIGIGCNIIHTATTVQTVQ